VIGHARPADHAAIAQVTRAAFGQPAEAELVDRLRADGDVVFELVASDAGTVVGHILFSRLWADSQELYVAMAPVSVHPNVQRTGVGSRLVRRGLEVARELGAYAVLVLGDPAYYSRFGFTAQAAARVKAPYAGSPAFMGLALEPGALDRPLLVAYPGAFSA